MYISLCRVPEALGKEAASGSVKGSLKMPVGWQLALFLKTHDEDLNLKHLDLKRSCAEALRIRLKAVGQKSNRTYLKREGLRGFGGHMGRARYHQGRLIQMEISRTRPSYPAVCYKRRLRLDMHMWET